MPSGDLSYWLFLTQRFFDDLIALSAYHRLGLAIASSRRLNACLWPSYSHLSRVPNLLGRDICYTLCFHKAALLSWRNCLVTQPLSRKVRPYSFLFVRNSG